MQARDLPGFCAAHLSDCIWIDEQDSKRAYLRPFDRRVAAGCGGCTAECVAGADCSANAPACCIEPVQTVAVPHPLQRGRRLPRSVPFLAAEESGLPLRSGV